MVRKVATPARSSVRTVVPCSERRKYRSSTAMKAQLWSGPAGICKKPTRQASRALRQASEDSPDGADDVAARIVRWEDFLQVGPIGRLQVDPVIDKDEAAGQ